MMTFLGKIYNELTMCTLYNSFFSFSSMFIAFYYSFGVGKCDAPEDYQIWLQDPATEGVEWLINLHDAIMVDLLLIIGTVGFMVYVVLTQFNSDVNPISNRFFSHSKHLEIFWTLIPAFILFGIATPTFSLLYALEDFADGDIVIKITGHQWYWTYEQVERFWSTCDAPIMYSSYMINTTDLQPGRFRLLEVDNRIKVPTKTYITLFVTSADVLHSWAIPSFGVKVDACPGRLSKVIIFIKRPGLYFG